MMRFLFCFLCLFTTVALAEPTIEEEIQNNTVVLSEGSTHGSGVLFSRDGVTFIWTAAHVANHFIRDNGSFRKIKVTQGFRTGTAVVLRCGDHEVDTDCALLKLVEVDSMPVGTATFFRTFNQVKLGQRVIHCGTPFDRVNNERLISFGRISYVSRLVIGQPLLKPRRLDQVDITAYGGCSGGPVCDAETGGIVGLLVMGSAPHLIVIEPTRNIYQWAKTHDCLWAFDREVPLPESIIPWRGDLHGRIIANRDTEDVDARWGGVKSEPQSKLQLEPPA